MCSSLSSVVRTQSPLASPHPTRSLPGEGEKRAAWGLREPSDQPCLRKPDSAAVPQPVQWPFCPAVHRWRVTSDLEPPGPSSGPRPLSPARRLPQVFEEEHHILYLDHGGVIVAIKDTSIPLKILK